MFDVHTMHQGRKRTPRVQDRLPSRPGHVTESLTRGSTPTPTQAIGATQPNHNNTKLRFARKVIARCINLMPFSGSNLNKWQQNGQERQTEKQSFGWLIANENSISRVESPCERLMSALSLSLLRRFENSFIINLQEFMNCS